MTEFRMIDTKRPDGCYIRFEQVHKPDDTQGSPDQARDGFWPSHDKDAAGYVEPENFAKAQADAESRMRAFERGDWEYIGVIARAHVTVVRNNVGTMLAFDSPGLWGIESDSGGDYLNEVFREECDELKDTIAAFANPTYEAD